MPGQRQSRGGDAPYPQDQRSRGGRPQGRGRSSRGDYYPDTDMGMPDPRPQRDPRRGGYDDRGYDDRGGYDRDARRGGYDDRAPRRGYDDRAPRGGYDDRGYDDRGYDDRPARPQQKQGGGGKAFGKFLLVLLFLIVFLAGGAFLGLMLGGKGVIPESIIGKFGLAPRSSVPDPALVASDKKDLVSYWENEEGIKDLSEKLADGTVKDLIDGKKSSTSEGNKEASSGDTASSSSTSADNGTGTASGTQQTASGAATTTGQPAGDGVAQAQQVDPATGQPVATPSPAPAPAAPAPEQPAQPAAPAAPAA